MTENRRPEHETATMHINGPVADWCPRCTKTTLLRCDITALVSDGPHRVGEYAVCHECGYSPYTTYTTPPDDARARQLEEQVRRLRRALDDVSCAGSVDEVSDALDRARPLVEEIDATATDEEADR